jgi:hypothetical protein
MEEYILVSTKPYFPSRETHLLILPAMAFDQSKWAQ